MYVEKDAEMKEKIMSLLNVILMLSQKIFLSADGFFLHAPSSQYLTCGKSSHVSNQIYSRIVLHNYLRCYICILT